MQSVHLALRLRHALAAAGVRGSKPQRTNLAMLCYALAGSRDCHLNNLALRLPIDGQRDHLVQRLRRLLKEAPSWQEAYRPLVSHLLAQWDGVEVPLVMDRTDLTNRLSILTLGVAYGHRLLPLIWRVGSFGGTSAETQLALLDQVCPLLPPGIGVTFFGDAEFRAVDVQSFCRDRGWHWQVGLKSDVIIQTETGRRLALIDLGVGPRSGLVCYQNVRLTAQHAFGPVNILARWSKKDRWPRFWALDLPADRLAWRRGRKRFWIEPSFRDLKSYGFDLEATGLSDPKRIDALLLAMAITTLWLIHLGVCARTSSRRTLLETPGRHDYSLFRLGRDHLLRAREMHWSIPIGFTIRHPAPR
jgi:hypothetical protein